MMLQLYCSFYAQSNIANPVQLHVCIVYISERLGFLISVIMVLGFWRFSVMEVWRFRSVESLEVWTRVYLFACMCFLHACAFCMHVLFACVCLFASVDETVVMGVA